MRRRDIPERDARAGLMHTFQSQTNLRAPPPPPMGLGNRRIYQSKCAPAGSYRWLSSRWKSHRNTRGPLQFAIFCCFPITFHVGNIPCEAEGSVCFHGRMPAYMERDRGYNGEVLLTHTPMYVCEAEICAICRNWPRTEASAV